MSPSNGLVEILFNEEEVFLLAGDFNQFDYHALHVNDGWLEVELYDTYGSPEYPVENIRPASADELAWIDLKRNADRLQEEAYKAESSAMSKEKNLDGRLAEEAGRLSEHYQYKVESWVRHNFGRVGFCSSSTEELKYIIQEMVDETLKVGKKQWR